MSNKKTKSYEFDNFGQKVKTLRMQRGLSQQSVAKALDVTPGYVSNIENGRTAMSLRMLICYATLMGMTLDELTGEVIPEYHAKAVSNQLVSEISKLSEEQQEKLVKILRICRKTQQ
ncbi:MAG: helix-turn-helix transcriptional regulator [Eubacteriales bacterium]